MYSISLIKYLQFDRDYGEQKVNSYPQVSMEFKEEVLKFSFALHMYSKQALRNQPSPSHRPFSGEETDLGMVEGKEQWETPF